VYCGRADRSALQRARGGESERTYATDQAAEGASRMDRVLLTERQVEILVLLAWGEPVRCIAKELYLSAATVNYHLGRLRRIFGAQSLPSLVAAASVAGILTSDQLPVQGTGRLDVAPSEQ
jgi:DNA-binding CsgD family transcriptional regulator